MLYIVQLRVNPATSNDSRLLSIYTTGLSKERCCEYWFSEGKQGETGCKESHFYSLPLRQAEANIYQPINIISTSPKNVLMSRLISQFFCNLNSSKKFICPSGKLITKSTSPGPSDTTFSARQDTNRVQLTVLDNPWVNIIIICWEQVQVQLEVLGLGQGLSYRIKSSLRTCTSTNQILHVYQCLFLFYFLQHSNFLTLAAKVSINVADYMLGLDSLPLLYFAFLDKKF